MTATSCGDKERLMNASQTGEGKRIIEGPKGHQISQSREAFSCVGEFLKRN
jgi:hypothetical protein